MKKKYLLNLLTFMMVTIVSVGFVSCGDDDDNPNDNPNDNPVSIVGTWRCDLGDGDYEILILKDNGQGLIQGADVSLSNEPDYYSYEITYYYDKAEGRYKIVFEEAGSTYIWTIQYYDDTKLVLFDPEYGETATFFRVSH